MHDTFDVHKWNRERYLNEANEADQKDEFSKAEDKLYKAVTGEEPKASTKNKMREPIKEESYEEFDIMDKIQGELDHMNPEDHIEFLQGIIGFCQNEIKELENNV